MQKSLTVPSSVELAGKIAGFVAKGVALLAMAVVVLGLLVILGLLSEQILRAFSVSAGLKFESGVASWIGRHFLDIIKVVLWTVALGGLYVMLRRGFRISYFVFRIERQNAEETAIGLQGYLVILVIGAVVAGLGWIGLTTWQCPLVIPLAIVVLLLIGQGLSKSNVLNLAWRELSSWLLSP
ncbi:MAG: hypothetical protein KAT11_04515, partial [Phycisphaerae bacterium]|nr:hypothetical protein [Phycisphaerae bacterium]